MHERTLRDYRPGINMKHTASKNALHASAESLLPGEGLVCSLQPRALSSITNSTRVSTTEINASHWEQS